MLVREGSVDATQVSVCLLIWELPKVLARQDYQESTSRLRERLKPQIDCPPTAFCTLDTKTPRKEWGG